MVQTMEGPAFFAGETHWFGMQVAAHCLTLCKGCFSLFRSGGYCATLDLAQVCLEESPCVIPGWSLPFTKCFAYFKSIPRKVLHFLHTLPPKCCSCKLTR
jgi:hypothetical protein